MLIRRGYQSIHPGRRVQERNYFGTNYVNVLYIFLKLEMLIWSVSCSFLCPH